MDRKVTHYDKPPHQRWLYQLADIGMFKAILIIWAVCCLAIIVSVLLAKAVIAYFK